MRVRVHRRRHLRPAFGAAALTLLVSACAEDAPQDVLEPAGEVARKADSLWDLTFFIAVVVFFIVEGLLVYALIRFRHKPGREAAQFHGNTRLEVILTAVPALILAVIAVPTVATIMDAAEKPPGALNVTVTAHQFWWEFRYPDLGFATANEMHIPTNKDVYVTLEGATTEPVTGENEVNHSFWVPRLAGTQDVIPGRVNTLRLDAEEPGTYLGQCKEFCGLGHALMKLRVVAEEPADFEAWAAGQAEAAAEPARGPAAEGATLFAEGAEDGQFAGGPACSSCHAVESRLQEGGAPQPVTGPNLAHFASRDTFAGAVFETNSESLKAWLRDPSAEKPGALMPDLGLTEEQINDLVAYLQSLE